MTGNPTLNPNALSPRKSFVLEGVVPGFPFSDVRPPRPEQSWKLFL